MLLEMLILAIDIESIRPYYLLHILPKLKR